MLKNIMVLICIALALLLIACERTRITDAEIIAKNDTLLNSCLEHRQECLGGFMKWHNGPIVRVTNCDSSCGHLEIGFPSIEAKMAAKWLPSAVDWVTFPTASVSWGGKDWEEAAVEYERQFTSKL